MSVLMKCGHAAQGKTSDGSPVCVVCVGVREGAQEPMESPDMGGRMAKCQCGTMQPSSPSLAFFGLGPSGKYDTFYCGCRGWD